MSKVPRRRRPVAERFWEKVAIKGPDDCWLWQAGRGGYHRHYGSFFLDDAHRHAYAHRISWELTYGPIPDGLFVCHNCPDGDNPLCVNPAHLFLGTHEDNMRDAVEKGQTRRGIDSAPFRHFRNQLQPATPPSYRSEKTRGDRNRNAKLTEAQVVEIKRHVLAGDVSYTDLAKRYGVSREAISAIVNGKCWAWLSVEDAA